MSDSFQTQAPLRASADIEVCRVIGKSGDYTASHVATELVQPLGLSAEFTRLPPIVDYSLSTVHARGTQKDPVTLIGRGQKGHARVGAVAVTSANGRVQAMGDGSGMVEDAVPPCWVVGRIYEDAPAGSLVEVYVDPVYVAVGG